MIRKHRIRFFLQELEFNFPRWKPPAFVWVAISLKTVEILELSMKPLTLPLPGEILLQEDVAAGFAAPNRRAWLARVQHGHRTRRI